MPVQVLAAFLRGPQSQVQKISGLRVDLMYEKPGVTLRVRLSWATFNTRIGCPTKTDVRPPFDLGMEVAP